MDCSGLACKQPSRGRAQRRRLANWRQIEQEASKPIKKQVDPVQVVKLPENVYRSDRLSKAELSTVQWYGVLRWEDAVHNETDRRAAGVQQVERQEENKKKKLSKKAVGW